METTKQLLLELTQTDSVSGNELETAARVYDHLHPLGPCHKTPLGSIICKLKEETPDKPHLMLTAHMDEIGLIVTDIDDKGFLHVGNCGGIDRSALWAAQVTVNALEDQLPGVVCTIPPHLNPDEEKIPTIEELVIDIGMDAKQAREAVQPGDRISFCYTPGTMLNGLVCTKAADNRAGCAAVLLAAERLAKLDLDCSLSVLISCMEETGSQGARTGANELQPSHAIVVDVSHAYTPDASRHSCGELFKGAMIACAPLVDGRMYAQLNRIAGERQIPHQVEVMGGATGTDADGVAVSGKGVKTAILSIPQKYMHTPVEVVACQDIEAVTDLIVAYGESEFGRRNEDV